MGRLIVYYDDLITNLALGLGVVYRARPHDTSGNVDSVDCCHDDAASDENEPEIPQNGTGA
jgi:hypothetical protein